ncbi:MAG: agmatine deiminase family protein [Gammaproteobacteria bacterium]|nr:agmatine deiminase family protein [Gammaproteobacteria bacterium]
MKGHSAESSGYRMPAEWGPHQATWFSWPHNVDTWTEHLPAVERILADAVAALASSELVRINVRDSGHGYHVQKLLAGKAPADKVVLHQFPTNDSWCRDHGAIFVTRDPGQGPTLRALDFQYNAWGGKYPPFDLDNAIPKRMADALGVPVETIPMVLEGGSIEVNGCGTLLTTEQCLLNPNRNPAMNRQQIERLLKELLGVTQILWLGDGIAGDDTDGHIDDLTRFVAEDLVVTVLEQDPADENYAALRENRERLEGIELADGRPLRVVELPMPAPLYRGATRLPASYANFYVGNRVVLLPTFNCPADEEAAAILARCFPGRRIVSLDCRDVVTGLGTFHCLTQQIPVAPE